MTSTMLVVGAAGGVGLELTKMMIDRGYQVIGTVLNKDEANLVAKEAPGINTVIEIDLSNADNVKPELNSVLSATDMELKGVAVCAGIGLGGPLETTPLADLRNILEVNTVADVAVYQACMPYLRKTKGTLVIIVSNAGRSGIPFLGGYVASKHALEGLGDVMRRESAKFGVKISLIEPGSIKTAMQARLRNSLDDRIAGLSKEEAELYGHLYRAYTGMSSGGKVGMHPKVVAETMADVLESDNPKTRYQLGQDAIDSINMAFNATDEEIDAFYRNIFPID